MSRTMSSPPSPSPPPLPPGDEHLDSTFELLATILNAYSASVTSNPLHALVSFNHLKTNCQADVVATCAAKSADLLRRYAHSRVDRLPDALARYVRVCMSSYMPLVDAPSYWRPVFGDAGVLHGSPPSGWLPAHLIVRDAAREAFVLSIRGTADLKDLIVDLAGKRVPFCGGEVHSGMRSCALAFFSSAYSEEVLAGLLRKQPPTPPPVSPASEGAGAMPLQGDDATSFPVMLAAALSRILDEGRKRGSLGGGTAGAAAPAAAATAVAASSAAGGAASVAASVTPYQWDYGLPAVLRALLECAPGSSFVLTGHSLGGGISALVCCKLRHVMSRFVRWEVLSRDHSIAADATETTKPSPPSIVAAHAEATSVAPLPASTTAAAPVAPAEPPPPPAPSRSWLSYASYASPLYLLASAVSSSLRTSKRSSVAALTARPKDEAAEAPGGLAPESADLHISDDAASLENAAVAAEQADDCIAAAAVAAAAGGLLTPASGAGAVSGGAAATLAPIPSLAAGAAATPTADAVHSAAALARGHSSSLDVALCRVPIRAVLFAPASCFSSDLAVICERSQAFLDSFFDVEADVLRRMELAATAPVAAEGQDEEVEGKAFLARLAAAVEAGEAAKGSPAGLPIISSVIVGDDGVPRLNLESVREFLTDLNDASLLKEAYGKAYDQTVGTAGRFVASVTARPAQAISSVLVSSGVAPVAAAATHAISTTVSSAVSNVQNYFLGPTVPPPPLYPPVEGEEETPLRSRFLSFRAKSAVSTLLSGDSVSSPVLSPFHSSVIGSSNPLLLSQTLQHRFLERFRRHFVETRAAPQQLSFPPGEIYAFVRNGKEPPPVSPPAAAPPSSGIEGPVAIFSGTAGSGAELRPLESAAAAATTTNATGSPSGASGSSLPSGTSESSSAGSLPSRWALPSFLGVFGSSAKNAKAAKAAPPAAAADVKASSLSEQPAVCFDVVVLPPAEFASLNVSTSMKDDHGQKRYVRLVEELDQILNGASE